MARRKKVVEQSGAGGAGTGAPGEAAEKPALLQKDETPASSFPIVGIGASAGGLAAFEAFFSNLPPDTDTGMAFVLVQHLAPDHKSILAEIIRRYTRMQVFEVQDGMLVKPNCAYIIPPGYDMAFLGGALHLLDPQSKRGKWMPIDFFFRSLAQDQRERSICIVLSGNGSDGMLGVRTIKGEGGMVMAQAPETCEYDGMPRSAISTGLVDFVLPPAQMPAQLVAYVARALGKSPWPSPPEPQQTGNEIKRIFVLLRAQTGHDLSLYKPSTIHRRIERRMAIHQVETLESYVKLLQVNPGEVDALFRDLLIGVTAFFRDPEAFKALEELVIPRLFAGKPPGSILRIWAPGCSTGEEAYSLAILMAEYQELHKCSYQVQVFATDIDSQAIATARAGLYPASIGADLTPERLSRYFTPEPDGSTYRIHKTIRDMLIFSEQDVIKDPPFSKIDLISCRNLLIYMQAELQKRLIPLFHYALNPAGFLFLGTSETVGEFTELFASLDRKAKLYQRKESHQPAPLGRILQPAAVDALLQQPVRRMPRQAKLPLRELTEQALLQRVIQSGALVTSTGDVLYFHGRTGLYLEPAPGEVGVSNILKMAREGLRRELTTALNRAVASQEPVRMANLRVRTNGDTTLVNLLVCPVETSAAEAAEPPLYLVVLEQAPPMEQVVLLPEDTSAADSGARIAGLQRALQEKEEYLQSTTEELETVNEELKSSNEEMQSVNEELQSTNEELETSKEELQSVNEELATVNAELQIKVADLTRANNDMNNLLAGTNIATLFVDHSLRILRFTPAATHIINLIHTDIGRPIGHFVSNIDGYQRMTEDIREVLDTLIPKEAEVQTKSGAWYIMRIQPYRTLENVIEGAVITFVDITVRKKAEQTVQSQLLEINSFYNNAPIGLASLDKDLRFIRINERLAQLNGVPVEAHLGKTIEEIVPALAPLARQIVAEIKATGKPRVGVEFQGETRTSPGVKQTWEEGWYPQVNEAGEITGYSVFVREKSVGGEAVHGTE